MSPRAGAREPRSAKILHVEDNPENRLLVRTLLEAEGYPVVEAEDGLAGIEAAIREHPALILLDINLPGVDGYAVASILKSFPDLVTTPVIAITAYGMEGDRQRTLVAGCDGYINKPIDVDRFPRQVSDFLRGKRERVEEAEQSPYLRELNQRLVYRLVNQVEELKRLNDHFVRRAIQLEQLHAAVQDITSEVGVRALLERFLPALAQALGATGLVVELTDPAGVRVTAEGSGPERRRGVLEDVGADITTQWEDVELTLPLDVRERSLGTLTARLVLPPGAKSDEEQLLKIVANQIAIAVENARLYQAMVTKATHEEALVEAGRLLAGTLQMSEVLQRFAALVRSQLKVDLVRIWLKEGATGDAVLRTEVGELRRPGTHEGRLESGGGIVGWVLANGAPLMIADMLADSRVLRRDWVQAEGLRSAVALPLTLDGAVVGVLVGISRSQREFLAEEVALAEALANSAAVAIRNARLYEDAQQRLRQTETLLEVSRAVGATLELSEVARRTTREIVRILGADIGGSWLFNQKRDQLLPLAGYHVPQDVVAELATMGALSGEQFLAAMRELRTPLASPDSSADARFDHPFLKRVAHRSLLVVPMLVKDEIIGGFSIVWTREPHAFTTEELRLVEGLARQAAVAIENSRLYEDIRRQMDELRRTQAQLIQSAKLAAIGELTANVAHEINNPLTSVLGFASYLTEQVEQGQPMWEELDLIRSEAQRARDIVRDLLDFSRPRDFMPEMADLNHVVQQTLRMVQRQGAMEHVELREEYADSLPPIELDVPRMKQVFLNIINNAIHAMPEGGALSVRTVLVDSGVRVEFTDTGTGIAAEHLDRIFDPFFTTKPEVSGTGLGLSVSLGLVRHHGGTIEVASQLGEGSTFTIRLPLETGLQSASESV